MPQTIVIDTNYIRSIGCSEFLRGKVPPRLETQLQKATTRGDLILIPATVRTEINAWLKEESVKRHTTLHNAARTLHDQGFTITPALPNDPTEPDITTILKSIKISCDILMPTVAEYEESERRTSYRLPPHPKNPEHEEMRDRLIWCQLLNYSKSTPNSIIIASGDQIFKNGAASHEGIQARISIASTPEELDQRLGEIPDNIQTVINNLLSFADQLSSKGILVTTDNILSVNQLRKSRTNDSLIEERFDLLLKGQEKPLRCTITTLGGLPLQLMLQDMVLTHPDGINAGKPDFISKILQDREEFRISELRHIIGE